jgi:hypothetical protein
MTKAHVKHMRKALDDFEFLNKVSEKIRCTWHFAPSHSQNKAGEATENRNVANDHNRLTRIDWAALVSSKVRYA